MIIRHVKKQENVTNKQEKKSLDRIWPQENPDFQITWQGLENSYYKYV